MDARMSRKRAKNLLLDEDVLFNAEEYCRAHGTTLSLLVNDYLRRFPQPYEQVETESPIVRRLKGAASGLNRDMYRDFHYVKDIEASEKRLSQLRQEFIDDAER
jgi:hypothetical protein